jgi:GNAT superfamily N-acetyltransferase
MVHDRVRLREATSDDAAAIAELHTDSWRTTYRGAMRDAYLDGDVAGERRGVWRARLDAPMPNQHVIVAESEGRLVGFGCAYGAADPRWGTELDNLHVRAGEQGGGVGAELLAAVARWTRRNYPDGALYLWVLDGNVGARRFYERHRGRDAEGDHWDAPDGSALAVRRYVWPVDEVARLASRE